MGFGGSHATATGADRTMAMGALGHEQHVDDVPGSLAHIPAKHGAMGGGDDGQ
ncbi:hypothetical protein D3C81_2323400 [compost metagenome]